MRRMLSGCIAASLVAAGGSFGQATQQTFVTGIDRPVFLTHAPGEPDKLFVLEQEGQIRVIENGVLLPDPFLDIDFAVFGGNSGQDERGLLGLAFDPDYATNGRFYVNYTFSVNSQLSTRIESYELLSADPSGNTADLSSRQTILEFDQDFNNHNGGWLGFGPDGYLYISTGDGGSGNDPRNRASDLTQFLGKMLRIDVSGGGAGYSVPADNPFVGAGGGVRPEIWAYGLRNPWRTSFDSATGDLWIADVGQSAREEINLQPASSSGGENYGWRCREGFIATPGIGGCPSDTSIYTDPIYDYGVGCSVIGGYVYRGCEIPELEGMYIFADYCNGDVLALDPASPLSTPTTLFNFGFGVSSFGVGPEGEMYVMDVLAGFINRIVPSNPVDANGDGVIDSCEEPCRADTNGDGLVSPSDFNAWIQAFNQQTPACDQNGDGLCTPADFNAWIQNFNAGC